MKNNKVKNYIFISLAVLIIAFGVAGKVGVLDCIFEKNLIGTSIQDPLNPTLENAGTVMAPARDRTDRSVVSIVQSAKSDVRDINYEDIKKMVRQSVEMAGGFEGLIKDGSTVVLKPNLVTTRDYTLRNAPIEKEASGVTTDWRVTKAIVELVRECNPKGKVYVMEGSAEPTEKAMEYFNYTPEFIPGVNEFIAIEKDSGAWQDFKSPGIVKVSLPNGLIHNEYYLNKKYKDADVVISMPCLKNHWSAAVTGGIKNVSIGATPANIYGISANDSLRNNMVVHDSVSGDLHKWIHDFFACRPVDFVIMDGLQGIQNGPTPSYDKSKTSDISQDQKNMRLIVAGRDAVAVDTIESLIMCWDPESVGYLKYLDASKIGNLDVSKILVVGNPVDKVRKPFKGVTPPAGGSKITDKTKPKLVIEKCTVNKGMLDVSLDAGKETKKVEIYIDGKLCEPIIVKNFSNISAKIGSIGKGRHKVRFWSYDRFLNRSEKTLEIVNDAA